MTEVPYGVWTPYKVVRELVEPSNRLSREWEEWWFRLTDDEHRAYKKFRLDEAADLGHPYVELHYEYGTWSRYEVKTWYERVNGSATLQMHRDEGPAYINALTGEKRWCRHGQFHNVDGPARICQGGRREWWAYGRQLSKDYLKALGIRLLDQEPYFRSAADRLIFLDHVDQWRRRA